ncbi:MAG: peroxiredoxin [Zoogloea sp.]|nr:peroxiredoxin [Zoogloea sp.]MCA0184686.1 peroxiredoxin [Pseudomonadota bacterium]
MKTSFPCFALVGALLSILALPVGAALKEGDVAPNFEARASLAGKAFTYSLKTALSKGPVVLYFYPSAYTTGCNLQAHTFAEQYDRFVAAGASVIGVSLDSIARLNEFSADPDYCAGKLAVASDVDGRISRAYDLTVRERSAGRKDTRGVDIDHASVERVTYVLTSDGKVAATIGGVAPVANVERALETVQRLAAGRSPQ